MKFDRWGSGTVLRLLLNVPEVASSPGNKTGGLQVPPRWGPCSFTPEETRTRQKEIQHLVGTNQESGSQEVTKLVCSSEKEWQALSIDSPNVLNRNLSRHVKSQQSEPTQWLSCLSTFPSVTVYVVTSLSLRHYRPLCVGDRRGTKVSLSLLHYRPLWVDRWSQGHRDAESKRVPPRVHLIGNGYSDVLKNI